MSTDSNLNETDIPRPNGVSWLVIVPWLCLLWVFIAFCTLYGMLAHNVVDIKGLKSSPYDLLFNCVAFTGWAAMPVGIVCGVCALLFRKDKVLSLLPTLVLGLLLAGLSFQQYQTYQGLKPKNANPPVAIPVTTD